MNTRNGRHGHRKPDENALHYLTYPQAAALLQMSERKLADMKKHGKVPYIQLGKSIRFGRADLVRWLQEQTRGGHGDGEGRD